MLKGKDVSLVMRVMSDGIGSKAFSGVNVIWDGLRLRMDDTRRGSGSVQMISYWRTRHWSKAPIRSGCQWLSSESELDCRWSELSGNGVVTVFGWKVWKRSFADF